MVRAWQPVHHFMTLCGGRAPAGDSTTAWPLEICLGGSCLLVLTLLPVTSLSPLCHWYPSSCCSGAESQRWWVCIRPETLDLCRPFKKSLPRILQFLPSLQPPLDFTARSYRDLSSGTGMQGWVVQSGSGIPHS